MDDARDAPCLLNPVQYGVFTNLSVALASASERRGVRFIYDAACLERANGRCFL